MGRKSREKRERRAAKMSMDPQLSAKIFESLFRRNDRDSELESEFQKHIEQMQVVLQQYNRIDAALALSVSDLWPANVASPIKHMFAWAVLLRMGKPTTEALPIATYEAFAGFVNALYAVWPDFSILEDFSPEADWGQTKIRLGSDFVPMLYGSCIERTPDFVEAFRISYADVDAAQADMNLAVAVQAHIIESFPDLSRADLPEPSSGHVEVPPEEFWTTCLTTLLQLANDLARWRSQASKDLEIGFDAIHVPLTRNGFGNAVMEGQALPFLAVTDGEHWLPMSVRSLPGVVVDHWAKDRIGSLGAQAHQMLGHFAAQRFRNTRVGPMTPMLGSSVMSQLTVSCIVPSKTGVYLICACDHASYEKASRAAKQIYAALNHGELANFLLEDGRGFSMGRREKQGLSADEVRILIVLTQSSTEPEMMLPPERPTRLMPMADFVTIFDDLDEPDEIESFWKFIDGQTGMLSLFSRGLADLFASFKDSHGVLVEGATTPSLLMLDTHWGTSRRFQELSLFWSQAPTQFPDNSAAWRLSNATEGVTRMNSRALPLFSFSTQTGSCTVQTLVPIAPHLQIMDGRMLEMFAHVLADQFFRHRDLLSTLPFMQQQYLVLTCETDPEDPIGPDQRPESLAMFPKVVIAASRSNERPHEFYLNISSRAVLAGLNDAKDASFEIRCLIEVLRCCHEEVGLPFPDALVNLLQSRASGAARFQLQHAQRHVDVPDFVDPVVPSPTDYKLARKHLAVAMQQLGLSPGRYELKEAKTKIDVGRDFLRSHIEKRLASLDRHQLIQQFIEQHDALMAAERVAIVRARQSLTHEVEYDPLEAVGTARKELGSVARHYRYLLEKVLSSAGNGQAPVTHEVLRELVGLVDWYKVLADAGDVLHTGVDVGGIEIDHFYIPEIFYSTDSGERGAKYSLVDAKSRLGIDLNEEDEVVGPWKELLSDDRLRKAFKQDLGFELQHLLSALTVLSQPVQCGLTDTLALSYAATPDRLSQLLVEYVEGLELTESSAILKFLTLSGTHILRLAGRDVDEGEVPYWEHTKRIHRYTIRPLVVDGELLRWGSETTSRALKIWSSSVRDGYLPADFGWPNIEPLIREIKEGIEKRLEERTGEVILRHTPYMTRNLDFYRRFRSERFDDVGDFDVFAYWPETDTLLVAECKYNQPPHSMKDTRRLRDKIFGKSEDDRNGQFSRILRRRQFLLQHRSRLLELLGWPTPKGNQPRNLELYVSREVYYWMVHPPYEVPTAFTRIDGLDAWIKTEIVDQSADHPATAVANELSH